MLDEEPVTVSVPFEILSEVESPNAENAIPTASTSIAAVKLLCFTRISPPSWYAVLTSEHSAAPVASNLETRLSAIPLRDDLERVPWAGLIAGIGRLITLSYTFCQFERRIWCVDRQGAFKSAACRRCGGSR